MNLDDYKPRKCEVCGRKFYYRFPSKMKHPDRLKYTLNRRSKLVCSPECTRIRLYGEMKRFQNDYRANIPRKSLLLTNVEMDKEIEKIACMPMPVSLKGCGTNKKQKSDLIHWISDIVNSSINWSKEV